MKTIVFACVHNAGRSQMAAALFNTLVDPSQAHAVSAGTNPSAAVHPEVVATMNEIGIDLSSSTPRLLTVETLIGATHLVTMGCNEQCPTAPAKVIKIDWPIEDPKGKPVERVREIRDDLRRRVSGLVEELGCRKFWI
jgi:arsenate reductase